MNSAVPGDWTEVADHVFTRRHESWDLNVGLVVGAVGCLVIDTRVSPHQGRELAEAVRTVTALPWTVANTHAHLDHVLGNSAFAGAAVWGHVRCAEFLRQHGDDRLRELNDLEGADLADAAIVVPDRTFEHTATIDLGGRAVTLRHLGRGHTAGDIVAEVPDAEVVFTGDLIREGGPLWFEDAYPLDWPATLQALERVAHGAVVPGHGVVVDRDFVAGQRELLTDVAATARAAYEAGRPIHDAEHILPLKPRIARDALTRAYYQLAKPAEAPPRRSARSS
ncbi:MAG TPA: MBL fold metallo-hydrolase [Jatrophihabitantaceae bacterium]